MEKKEKHVKNHADSDKAVHDEEVKKEVVEKDQHKNQKHEDKKEIIDNLTEKVNSLQDKLLRSMAECENIRLRSNKMVEEAKDYSIVSFAKDLVPIIDHLSRALEHLPDNLDNEIKNVIEGVKLTKKELEVVIKKHGLELIEPQPGEKFDYNLHHAISQVMTDDHKEGNIVNTMQVGYKIKDRLLRPASVTVAKK